MNNFSPYLRVLAEKLLIHYKKNWFHAGRELDEKFDLDKYKIGNRDYERISELINDFLKKKQKKIPLQERLRTGLTVSPSTVERILTKKYKITFLKNGAIHPESEKILNKLAIFLGYKNWYEFINKTSIIEELQVSKTEKYLTTFVKNAAKASLLLLDQKQRKKININKYYAEDRDAIKFLHWEIEALSDFRIVCTNFHCEVYIEYRTDSYAVLTTTELAFTLILFKGKKNTERPIYTPITRLYILENFTHGWRIVQKHLCHSHYLSPFINKMFLKNTADLSLIKLP